MPEDKRKITHVGYGKNHAIDDYIRAATFIHLLDEKKKKSHAGLDETEAYFIGKSHCPHCGDSFWDPAKLELHKKFEHGEKKNLPYDVETNRYQNTVPDEITAHNKKVDDAFKKAAKGETINLSDLFISKENVMAKLKPKQYQQTVPDEMDCNCPMTREIQETIDKIKKYRNLAQIIDGT